MSGCIIPSLAPKLQASVMLETLREFTLEAAPFVVSELESAADLITLEQSPPKDIANLFRRCRCSGLAATVGLDGPGASSHVIAAVTQWVGSRSPSLAIMMAMHHHTVAGFSTLSPYLTGLQPLLRQVSRARLLVASAFADESPKMVGGTTGLWATPTKTGFTLNGVKKPCTMAGVMDFMLVGIRCGASNDARLSAAVLSARAPGLRREAFWSVPYLAAADSNAVIFDEVNLPQEQLFIEQNISDLLPPRLAQVENVFLCWFQLIAAAAYAGMHKRLLSEVGGIRGVESDALFPHLVSVAAIDASMSQLAAIVSAGVFTNEAASKCHALRYFVQAEIARSASELVTVAGASAAMHREDLHYLRSCLSFLGFHPPGRAKASGLVVSHAFPERAVAP